MKCACGRTHKTRADMVRYHDLLLMQKERDLYRARAIDEVAAHHKDATQTTATFDVDLEVRRHMQGVSR